MHFSVQVSEMWQVFLIFLLLTQIVNGDSYGPSYNGGLENKPDSIDDTMNGPDYIDGNLTGLNFLFCNLCVGCPSTQFEAVFSRFS